MKNRLIMLALVLTVLKTASAQDVFNQIDESGNVTQRSTNQNFNKHNTDTTSHDKDVPKGHYVWKVDRKFGDIIPALPDTMPHLYMNTTFNTGFHSDYNTTGSNFTARQSRIFVDREESSNFIFTQPYDYFITQPDQFLFVNTLSPYTRVNYDNCGDKQNGEDRIDAKFAVNVNKRLGIGFQLRYDYARGYFSDQSTSHFNSTLFGSYIGDKYQMHALFSANHQKTSENGGITNDEYITHPEIFQDSYTENEIPTVLSQNWNRNNHQHLFFTHRYNIGFYRKPQAIGDSIKDDGNVATDSLKRVYVPVTSFIHTLEMNNHTRIYQAYNTPDSYYNDRFYTHGYKYGNDSIYDLTKHLQVKNTFAIALMEGFNKYMKAGLKGFITHEYRKYEMPDIIENTDSSYQRSWNENNVSIGGLLSKTQGKTLHFNLQAEAWVVGEDAGQLKIDFNTDLNFSLLGDTVRLAAKAYMHRLAPTFYQRRYHAKNLWWDNEDMSKETRTRIEGLFSYEKTNTSLRVAIEEIQNYTYYGMSYETSKTGRTNMTAGVYQESGNINILTAQLHQNFRLGPLNWENVVTYQNSSNTDALPLPTWNFFTNLYLKFKIARVLDVELGADGTYFTKYNAPDFCPMINQFAIQQNEESRMEMGGYPFVDVYANMKLKGVRFFVMMSNVFNGAGNHMKFLTPHYPTNGSVMHMGVSWPFFN